MIGTIVINFSYNLSGCNALNSYCRFKRKVSSNSNFYKIMRKVFILFIILFLIIPTIVLAQQPVTVKEYKKIFKTYPYSDPDPVPHPQSNIYPYYRFDGYTNKPIDKEWTVVELENDFIRVLIMPEIGGKIWTAIEKSTQKPFIYNNEVVKFRDVAMRGAWTSGGIEANYGIIGHTPNCSAPVDYLTQKNEDGSISCFIGWLDLLTRTWWRIEVKLEKDKAYFTTHSLWHNATPLEQPYYHWMNVGIKAAGNLEFVYEGNSYLGHEGEIGDWKINNKNGKNISFYEQNNFGSYKSYHVFGKYSDFFGGYWHDEDFGMGRFAPHSDKAGKKIWIWGLSQEGMLWEKLLTDTNGQYVEVQSGRLYNQAAEGSNRTPFKQKGFSPYSTDIWTEYWFPIKGTKGFIKANDKLGLNVKEGKIWLMALQNIDNELVIKNNNQVLFKEKVILKPMQVFQTPLNETVLNGNLDISVSDNILHYSQSIQNDNLNRPTQIPKGFDENTAYALWLAGKNLLQMREYDKAYEKLTASLQKEPYFIPTLCDLAQLHFQRMNYTNALELLKKALSINTYDGQANYLYGLVNIQLGKITDAKDGFDIATLSNEYRSAAYTELAKIYFKEKDLDAALNFAEKSLDNNKQNIIALHIAALCSQLKKKSDKASAFLSRIKVLNPLYAQLLDEKQDNLLNKNAFKQLKNEMPQETSAEIDAFYQSLGFDLEWGTAFETHSILMKNNTDKFIRLSPNLYFPFRPENVISLENIVKTTNDWKPRYYLALLKWHFRDIDAAKKLFLECTHQSDFAPFYAARADLFSTDSIQFQSDMEHAISLNPNEWRYGKSLTQFYTTHGNNKKALEIATKYQKALPDNYYIGLLYAQTLLLNENWEQGIDFMKKLNVLPNEGATNGRILWKELNLQQAVVNIKAKKYERALKNIENAQLWLENLGVGKPYQEDIDERLENYLMAICYERLGNKNKADSLINKTKTIQNSSDASNVNNIISKYGSDMQAVKNALLDKNLKENENLRVLKRLVF